MFTKKLSFSKGTYLTLELKLIQLPGTQTWATHMWFEPGRAAEFILNRGAAGLLAGRVQAFEEQGEGGFLGG